MTTNAHLDAQRAAGEPATVTVEIPVSLIRDAEAAASEYGEYGSNDGEHDALLEVIASANIALGHRSGGTHDQWRIAVRAGRALTSTDLDRVRAADLPFELVDTLEIDGELLHALVDDEALGVAQAAATDLAEVVGRVAGSAEIVEIRQAS